MKMGDVGGRIPATKCLPAVVLAAACGRKNCLSLYVNYEYISFCLMFCCFCSHLFALGLFCFGISSGETIHLQCCTLSGAAFS